MTHSCDTKDNDCAGPDSVHRVLVVEDSPLLRVLTVKQLEKLGLQTYTADNGLAAVEAFKEKPFHLIFMDVHIPQLDGFGVTMAIRQLEGTKVDAERSTIVGMTAGFSKDRQLCLDAGMDDFLTKPVSVEDLKRTVKKWLPQCQLTEV